ncbi:MAG: hypothetical protein ABRQ38_15075 [Candidatus Eremiobacterota bacterium]
MIKFSWFLLLIFFLSHITAVFAQMETETAPVVIDLTTDKIELPEKLKGFTVVNKNGDMDVTTRTVIIEKEKSNNMTYPEDMKDLFSTPSPSTPVPATTTVSDNTDKINGKHNNSGGVMFVYFLVALVILTAIILYSGKKFIVRGNE